MYVFTPDDKIKDVYQSVRIPSDEDDHGLERLAMLVRKKHGVAVYSLQDTDITLGKLFEMIRFKKRQNANTTGF